MIHGLQSAAKWKGNWCGPRKPDWIIAMAAYDVCVKAIAVPNGEVE
jgi:hypothetical protein